ncbi:MAG: DUF2156 domain-containing protein [Myxococcales bacterium]|nr:DUF2156 domain-containing protein [Myxococcales bacterium]
MSSVPEPEPLAGAPERTRALEILRIHGACTVSFQLLEAGFEYFFHDDGFVAYFDTGQAWVAGGPPIGPAARIRTLAVAFEREAARAGRRVCYFGVEADTVRSLRGKATCVGQQPIWEPAGWPRLRDTSASLRYQLRRAQRKGVVVREVTPGELATDSTTRRGIERVIVRWQGRRPMAPMGFLVDLQPFGHEAERLTLVAERGGRVVGFLAAVPIYGRSGWFFEDLLRADDAPNGTAELLFDAGMQAATRRRSLLVTLGLSPLSGDVPRVLQSARDLAQPLYDFAGLHAFKRKLVPTRWEPVYLVGDHVVCAFFDTLVAFARGSLFRFGLRTFLRGPEVVLHALAVALSAWTVVIAVAAPLQWFPSQTAQTSWIVTHWLVLTGLVELGRRYRPGLAFALATIATVDLVATVLVLATREACPAQSFGQLVLLLCSCAGPMAGSLSLWGLFLRQARGAGRAPRRWRRG